MSENHWPKQADCPTFYGNPDPDGDGHPNRAWEDANLTRVVPPWQMVLAWDASKPVKSILIHKKCAPSLATVLQSIWEYCGRDQFKIEVARAHLYGGAYNFRLMRGSSRLSMHSYGCAIDLDPEHNAFGSAPTMAPQIVKAFEDQGWVWGGLWKKPDGQHFQAAIVS